MRPTKAVVNLFLLYYVNMATRNDTHMRLPSRQANWFVLVFEFLVVCFGGQTYACSEKHSCKPVLFTHSYLGSIKARPSKTWGVWGYEIAF